MRRCRRAPKSRPGVEAKTVPQFQVDPFWPKPLPNNWLVGQVAGVHVDKRDHIWIIHRPASLSEREVGATSNPPISKCCFPAPPVLEFDQDGNLVRFWGGPGAGYEWPASEHGIHVDNNDFVWIGGNGEKDSQILKFTLDGKFVLQIGKAGRTKAATTPATSADLPTSRSTKLHAKSMSPTDTATGG